MKKPTLVIMAAGMGSRYGGLKQIDPVDSQGNIIMDFSIYDAKKAGFEQVVFIIKRENEQDFRKAIGDRISSHMDVSYVYQELSALPEGWQPPQGRVKPFGTGHAILCCKQAIEGPFAVINADDYYGSHAFTCLYQYLSTHQDDNKYRYCMVAYVLGNTLTDNGHVARGICQIDRDGYLMGIQERTHIEKRGSGAAYTEDDGRTWSEIDVASLVSMNMWGFSQSVLKELEDRFPAFLEKGFREDPMKCEYFLPTVVGELLTEGKATVEVLKSVEQWHGVTYKEDRAAVVDAIQKMKEEGKYPDFLWGNP
ncbi:MAG: nucleotidyltransferase [Lachnospiraceae bacterium]|nr:nucleotidyltransferase [Lachnospiraceae bacterium]